MSKNGLHLESDTCILATLDVSIGSRRLEFDAFLSRLSSTHHAHPFRMPGVSGIEISSLTHPLNSFHRVMYTAQVSTRATWQAPSHSAVSWAATSWEFSRIPWGGNR